MLKKKSIEYLGIENPATPSQIAVEIAGLKHIISLANEKIASLEQAIAIFELDKNEK